MLRGKKWMKLQNKTSYFEYLPGESVCFPGETMVIDFPDADKDVSQCISLTLNPEFVQESLDLLNFQFKKWTTLLNGIFLWMNFICLIAKL
jgi:hypothetical protein